MFHRTLLWGVLWRRNKEGWNIREIRQKSRQGSLVDDFKEGTAVCQTPHDTSSLHIDGGKLPDSSNGKNLSDMKIRSTGEQSPSIIPNQVSFQEALTENQVNIAGKLALFLPKWKEITSNQIVLQAVTGYRLPFTHHPFYQVTEPRIWLSTKEQDLCEKEIVRLSGKGAIESVPDQFVSSFFVTEKLSRSWRFILNLKRLNEFIFATHFKIEDQKTVIRMLLPKDFLASIDLENAPAHPEDRKYLRFRFKNQLFQFTALPFGLASAPFIFT